MAPANAPSTLRRGAVLAHRSQGSQKCDSPRLPPAERGGWTGSLKNAPPAKRIWLVHQPGMGEEEPMNEDTLTPEQDQIPPPAKAPNGYYARRRAGEPRTVEDRRVDRDRQRRARALRQPPRHPPLTRTRRPIRKNASVGSLPGSRKSGGAVLVGKHRLLSNSETSRAIRKQSSHSAGITKSV